MEDFYTFFIYLGVKCTVCSAHVGEGVLVGGDMHMIYDVPDESSSNMTS